MQQEDRCCNYGKTPIDTAAPPTMPTESVALTTSIEFWTHSGDYNSFPCPYSFLLSQRPVWLIIWRSFQMCWWFGCWNTTGSSTAPQRAGACWAIPRWWIWGYISSSDLIHVVVALSEIKPFLYALRDQSGSKFHLVSESVDGLLVVIRPNPIQRCEEPVCVRPFRDVRDAAIHHTLT